MGEKFDDEATPEPEVPSARRATEVDLIREEQVRLGHRITAAEARVAALEEKVSPAFVSITRQWRYLRRYLGRWLGEDLRVPAGKLEGEQMLRQWRRFRKYVAVWLRED